MLKFFVKALGVIVALSLSGAACAVGLGGISVSTALGEPLKAEVELAAVGKSDKNNMSARLASPDEFKRAGLDYPSSLPKLKFQIEERANGTPYIKVTSAQPVNEPFVSLLLELTWPSGSLLREYTFLLDPPGFKPEQPKATEVHPLEPNAASATETKTEAAKEEPLPMRAAAPMDEKAFVEPANASRKPAEKSNVASGTIKVKRGDTLSKIARDTKSPDISLERMLVAMYRANEDVFDDRNMNRLRTGKILRVPEGDDLNKVEQVDAVKEIHAQAADWHAYRMKLAAASNSAADQEPKQEVSGKISTTVADKTPAAKESAKEVVRLSKGEAPGDKAAGGNAKAMQDKLHAMEEEAIAKSKALKDSNERIAMLEKNIKEMQRLVELKGQPVPPKAVPSKAEEPAPAEAKPASKFEPAKIEVKPLAPAPSAAAPASAVKPARPAAPKVVPPPPSMLDDILDEPLYLAGGAAALLGLGGFGFMLARRRKGGKSKEVVSVGTHIAAPIASSPDTGDFTNIATATESITSAATDDVDPISEADLFLNFGRDKQAEEILKDALKKNPGNQQVRLKLLSIYANRKDAKTFSGVAREVQDSGDAAAWAQAAEMGRKLEPGNPMYGGDGGAVEVSDALSSDEVTIVQPAASLDFDLGFDAPKVDAAEPEAPVDATATSTALDFDLGSDTPAEAAPAVAEPENTVTPDAPQGDKTDASVMDFDLGFDVPEDGVPAKADFENTMDFDITAEHPSLSELQPEPAPEQTEKPAPSLDDLVFDVTAAHPAMVEETAATEPPAEAEEAMEFTLDFPGTEESSSDNKEEPVAAKEADALDLSEINLNLDAPVPAPPAPAEDVKDAHWHDVATKLDLARAYQEMGDASGAKEILEEVLKEGDAQQRKAAQVMIQQLSI